MVIVWTWFFYFVFFEWWFAGTPGILLLGLRLRGCHNGKITLAIKCLARNLLTLIVPLTGAGRIQMIPTESRLGTFAQWSVVTTILSILPLPMGFVRRRWRASRQGVAWVAWSLEEDRFQRRGSRVSAEFAEKNWENGVAGRKWAWPIH
jgi:hypothetical protein